MVELKLFLMPPLKRSGRVKTFLENTTQRVEIFQKSRLGLDSSLEGRFHIFASKTVRFNHCYRYISLFASHSLTLYVCYTQGLNSYI